MIRYYLSNNNEMCYSTKIQTFHQLNTPIVELRDRLDVASGDAAGPTNHDRHGPHLVSILDLRTKFDH